MSKSWIESKFTKHILTKHIFDEYGGKSMGLKALDWLTLRVPSFKVPKAFIVKHSLNFNEFFQNCIDNIPDSHFKTNKQFSVKSSTKNDDFSDVSIRGKNSSNGKTLHLNWRSLKQYHQELSRNDQEVKSVIFQDFVCEGDFFILHYDKDGILVELLSGKNTFFYKFDKNHDLECIQSASEDELNIGSAFLERLLSIIPDLEKVKTLLEFDINLEGFITPDTVYLIQLRPIPTDFEYRQINSAKYKTNTANPIKTNFVFGEFVETITTEKLINIESYRIRQHLNSHEPLVFINNTEKLPLEFDIVKKRVEKGLLTTILNTSTGFLLAHSKKHIPLVKHRNYFRCFSVSTSDLHHLKRFMVVSNGYQAILLSR